MKLLQDLSISRKLGLAFGCVVVSVIGANALVYMANKSVDAANIDATASRERVLDAGHILSTAVEAQNAMRGLYATADHSFIDGYREKVGALDEAIETLRSHTVSEDDLAHLSEVEAALATFREEADRAIELGANSSTLEANRSALASVARLSRTRDAISAMIEAEQAEQAALDVHAQAEIDVGSPGTELEFAL